MERVRMIAAIVGLIVAGMAHGEGTVPAPEIPKLTIGTVLPLSGAQATFGKEAARGVELALEELRKREPEVAANVTWINGDDQSTVKEATALAERLLSKERAHLLIGSISSASTAAIAAIAKADGRPLILPISVPQGARGGSVYAAAFDDGQQGAILAELAKTKLGKTTAAVLRDDSAFAQSVATRFTQAFTAAGGKVAATEVYDFASEDYAAQLGKIRASGADIVLLPAAATTAAKVMEQATLMKLDVTFLGPDSWDSAALAKAAGKKTDYLVTHFASDDDAAATKAFIKAFTAKYGRPPGGIAGLAFDATNLALDAFKRAGNNLKESLNKELARTQNFEGATGTMSMAEGTGELLKTGVVKKTKSGKLAFDGRIIPKPEVTPPKPEVKP